MSDAYSTGTVPGPAAGISIRPTPQGDRSSIAEPYQPPGAQPPQRDATAAPQPDAPAQRADIAAPYTPPEPSNEPRHDVGAGEATARGVFNSLTFGFAPGVAGLAEASGMPSTAKNDDELDINPIRPVVGAAKLLHEWLSQHPDPKVVESYTKGRESYANYDKAASDQHGVMFLVGQLAGALATPMGAAGGVGAAAKAGRMIAAGGVTGGLNAAGEETSKGGSVGDVAKGAAKGVVAGAAIGGVGAGVAHGVGTAAGRVAEVVRGARNPEKEASSRIANAMTEDAPHLPPVDPLSVKMGQEAGTPVVLGDVGGGNVRSLARRAADTSGTANHALGEFTQDRFHTQNERIAGWLRGRIGGNDAVGVQDGLKAAGRKFNKPLYQRAYAKGAGGVWNPELENLTSAPAVQDAIQAAVQRGRNRAVAEGFGGYAEKVKVNPDGSVTLGNGNIPTMQFWDYVQRELRDASSKAFRAGANEEGDAARQLHKQLLGELDKAVPEFGAARGNAARFFKAGDALEAGQNFVTDQHVSPAAAIRALSGMNTAERELFKVGFMSDMADRVANSSNSVNIINAAFMSSPAARNKIVAALGPKDAKEFEALLRVEARVDALRPWLGGSQTSRNIGHAMATGSAIGLIESAKEGDFSPKSIVFGMAAGHLLKKGAHTIDMRVADKVAEMLLSKDPAVLKKGLATVTRDPRMFNMLRAATQAAGRETEQNLGPDRAAAAAATGAMNVVGASHSGHHDHNSGDPIAGQIDANQ